MIHTHVDECNNLCRKSHIHTAYSTNGMTLNLCWSTFPSAIVRFMARRRRRPTNGHPKILPYYRSVWPSCMATGSAQSLNGWSNALAFLFQSKRADETEFLHATFLKTKPLSIRVRFVFLCFVQRKRTTDAPERYAFSIRTRFVSSHCA